MIGSIQLLRKTGAFDNVSSGAQLLLASLALIYGENARGKTTLSSILRSLGNGDPQPIVERKRLGSSDPPHVVIAANGSTAVFQNGAWNSPRPEVFVFDDHFVADNVHSGMEVGADHRQKLHELIIGAQGIALNDTLQGHVARVEEHNRELQTKAAAIPASVRGGLDIDAFCALDRRDDIDAAVQETERNLAAGRDSDMIRQEKDFTPLALPAFDLAMIDGLLSRSLPSLEADAAARVQAHLTRLKSGGEAWVAEGMNLIEPASEGRGHEVCPFCTQDLEGSALMAHYRAYFSEDYEGLKRAVDNEAGALVVAHTGDVVAAFERAIGTAKQRQQFWNRFTPVPAVDLDTATIAVMWKKAYEALAAQLRQKQSSPLERLALSDASKVPVADYEMYREAVAALSSALMATNEAIAVIKERAQSANISALQSDLTKLQVLNARFDPATAALCDDYLAEKAAKAVTEGLRDAAREVLDQYRNVVFPAYETAINNYLQRLNAGFRLGSVMSMNIRSGSTCNYNVLINDVAVPLVAGAGERSFRTTLSAGDRNALALAFFFACLDRHPNKSALTVVIDDPMTSLDEHRSLTTIQEVRRLAREVAQVIVLSHSKPFLCKLWEGADPANRSAMRIARANPGSTLAAWNVSQDCINEHDRHHALVAGYIDNSVGADDRAVAQALRPILEAFMRVAYPRWYPPGTLLGPFLGLSRQRENTPDQILSVADNDELRALLDYANQFHHNTNAAYQTVVINDHELLDFSRRTLAYTRRT